MTGQLRGMYRRAVVTLVPPVVAGAFTVGVFATLAHRLPDRVDGAGGIVEAMPWSRVLVEGLVWSVLALIWGVVWLYVRRRVQGGQRWIAATTSGRVDSDRRLCAPARRAQPGPRRSAHQARTVVDLAVRGVVPVLAVVALASLVGDGS